MKELNQPSECKVLERRLLPQAQLESDVRRDAYGRLALLTRAECRVPSNEYRVPSGAPVPPMEWKGSGTATTRFSRAA